VSLERVDIAGSVKCNIPIGTTSMFLSRLTHCSIPHLRYDRMWTILIVGSVITTGLPFKYTSDEQFKTEVECLEYVHERAADMSFMVRTLLLQDDGLTINIRCVGENNRVQGRTA